MADFTGSAQTKAADCCFESFDLDGGGDLDLNEIVRGLKVLKSEAKVGVQQQKVAKQAVEAKRATLAHCEETARTVAAHHAAMAELQKAQQLEQPIEHRVIGWLKDGTHSGSININDVVNRWDANGDGSIDRHEFLSGIRAYSAQATGVALDELFGKMVGEFGAPSPTGAGAGGGGVLTRSELRSAFKSFLATSDEYAGKLTALKKRAERLRSTALEMQRALEAREAVDEAARADREAARQEAEAEKAAKQAKEAAKAAARIVLAQVKAKEDAGRFAQQVATKRKASSLHMPLGASSAARSAGLWDDHLAVQETPPSAAMLW